MQLSKQGILRLWFHRLKGTRAELDEESILELECEEEEETKVLCRWVRVLVLLQQALGLRDSISVRQILKASQGVARQEHKPRAHNRYR
jgi:hypothetical protein